MHKKATAQKWIGIFEMNEATGGRSSICSSVAMVPCAFAGLDFDNFIKGMSDMDENTRQPTDNLAFMMAAMIDC